MPNSRKKRSRISKRKSAEFNPQKPFLLRPIYARIGVQNPYAETRKISQEKEYL